LDLEIECDIILKSLNCEVKKKKKYSCYCVKIEKFEAESFASKTYKFPWIRARILHIIERHATKAERDKSRRMENRKVRKERVTSAVGGEGI
jgi:hypothetical protein